MNGFSALIKETPKGSHTVLHVRTQKEVCDWKEGPAPDLGLPASRTVSSTLLLFISHPVCSILL